MLAIEPNNQETIVLSILGWSFQFPTDYDHCIADISKYFVHLFGSQWDYTPVNLCMDNSISPIWTDTDILSPRPQLPQQHAQHKTEKPKTIQQREVSIN